MYIFLDVDGVLNTEADWARKVYSLNPKCVDQFCRLLKSLPDPKVVLSSTWRNGIARDGTTAVRISSFVSDFGKDRTYRSGCKEDNKLLEKQNSCQIKKHLSL
jgi:hypothetical protein